MPNYTHTQLLEQWNNFSSTLNTLAQLNSADALTAQGPNQALPAILEKWNNFVNNLTEDTNKQKQLQDSFSNQLLQASRQTDDQQRNQQLSGWLKDTLPQVTQLIQSAPEVKPPPYSENINVVNRDPQALSGNATPSSWKPESLPGVQFTSLTGELSPQQQARVENIYKNALKNTNQDFVSQSADTYKLDDKGAVVQKNGDALTTDQQKDYQSFYAQNIQANLNTASQADKTANKDDGFQVTYVGKTSATPTPKPDNKKSQDDELEQQQQQTPTPRPTPLGNSSQ